MDVRRVHARSGDDYRKCYENAGRCLELGAHKNATLRTVVAPSELECISNSQVVYEMPLTCMYVSRQHSPLELRKNAATDTSEKAVQDSAGSFPVVPCSAPLPIWMSTPSSPATVQQSMLGSSRHAV